jgi:hypothetical protein
MAGVLCTGCTFHVAPLINVLSATVTEATDEAYVISIDLVMMNPGTHRLELHECRYTVRADAAGDESAGASPPPTLAVYTGRRATHTTLSPREQAPELRLSIPAVIRRDGHQKDVPSSEFHVPSDGPSELGIQYSELRWLAVEGTLEYVPPGQLTEMLLDLGLPRPKARFAERVEVRPQGVSQARITADTR